jgi:PAS domain S-box-containing protein
MVNRITPRFFQHWNRKLGFGNRVEIQGWQTLGKIPVKVLNAVVSGQNPRLERAINWVDLKINTLQENPYRFSETFNHALATTKRRMNGILLVISTVPGFTILADHLKDGNSMDYMDIPVFGIPTALMLGVGHFLKNIYIDAKVSRHKTKEAARIYEQTLAGLNDGVLKLNPDGEIEGVNRKLLDLTGYTLEEALKVNPAEFVHADYRGLVFESIVRVRAGESIEPTEVIVLKKNGGEIPMEFTASLLTASSGEKSISVVVRDIAERKRRQASTASLRMRQREMKASASAIQGLIHALSQKFTGLLGYVDLVEMKVGETDAETREDFKVLSEVAGDITRYFKIYNVFTLGLGKKIPLEVKSLVAQSVERVVEKFSDKFVRINVMVSNEIEKIVLPQDVIMVILEAILTNAYEAVGRKGFVSLSISRKIKKQREGLLIEIADNGRGMSPEEQVAIFRPFYSTKPDAVTREKGLPLALVQYTVHKLGGYIDVESRESEGSTFKIWLPIEAK